MTRGRTTSIALILIALGVLTAVLWRSGLQTTRKEIAPGGGELIGSVRADPRTFNKFVARESAVELIAMLTQSRLVRVNRATFALEPRLAERWEQTGDGPTYTLHLRRNVTWSDGVPFTSADVVFSFEAAFNPRVPTVPGSAMAIDGKPLGAEALDAHTVRVVFPGPFGPGVRLLDNLTIYPKHKLDAALRAGTFGEAWSTKTPPSEMAGTGPFVLKEYVPGQRLVFERNPHYWIRDGASSLPRLDRLVLEIVPDQNAELLRLTSGHIDLMDRELRADDYLAARRAADEGRLHLIELGVRADADAFWFCLKPEAKKKDPRFAFVQKKEFRQAISHAVDRERFANTVFFGAAVPVWGPITPGNAPWYWDGVPRYDYDPERAKALLKSIGLEDRNGNGVVEDAKGTEARFTVITQRGVTAFERGTAVLRESAAKIGIALDIAPLEFNAMIERMLASNYDAIYMLPATSDLDPALNKDLWLSSGDAHFWDLSQKTPTTAWEREIDDLMRRQAATLDPDARKALFNDVQRIFAENLPVLYFAAPKVYYGTTPRVRGAIPSVMRPPVLWNADSLSVTKPVPAH